MEEIQSQIDKEQAVANKKKAMVPNFARLLANLIILFFVPSDLHFFKNILWVNSAFAAIWLLSEFILVFNYRKYKILPYLPATSDLISTFIIIYLTGSGNSTFSAILVSLVVISNLFSADTFQSIFILTTSLLLYLFLLIGLYFNIYPYVNLMDFGNNPSILTYLFSFFVFSFIMFGLFNSVRGIGKANIELNEKLKELIIISEKEKNRSEKLLLNILPVEVAEELKDEGFVKPVLYENVTILFTDFEGFTKIAERMSPEELLKTLDASFTQFDKVIEKNKLEKLKTIGDSYMCAGGLPIKNKTHPIDACLAGLELKRMMTQIKELQDSLGLDFWELRIGIHCGPVIAGVIGEKKFAYDIWGDAVNTASRLESSGATGEINISKSVFNQVKNFFICEYRGKIPAKNKGDVDMYFLKRIIPEFSSDEFGIIPNEKFWELYRTL
ncbi:MAG: adenylate/guanylate cyclase domain-containing protein [Leptospiraceae bacterium]|jgi:class 3 adenylate cyclase|nr:adenylate/guanylate cyclase domain-containing protein [Leptospiraceae bacterium]